MFLLKSTARLLSLFALLTTPWVTPSFAEGLPSLSETYDIPESVRQSLVGELPGGYSVDEVLKRRPRWPNPFLAFLPPDADPDMGYWRARAMIESRLRQDVRSAPRGILEFDEVEPNDSTSTANVLAGLGTGDGEGSEATVAGGLSGGDVDVFAVELEVGDVVGLAVTGGAGRIELWAPSEEVRLGSSQNSSFVYPFASPLPTFGTAVGAYVVERAGTWWVAVSDGSGNYSLNIRLFQQAACQKLFVDFDGPEVNPAVWGGPPGLVTLSPLSSFLTAWNLDVSDEIAVIDGILGVLEENLRLDLMAGGNNPFFDLQILNSRDHPGSFGDPEVSRVIAGGTVGELGFQTIGIAQSVDPGNFVLEEDAVVLLDLLSAPSGEPFTLNQFNVNPPASKVDLVAQGVGNILAHEVAHYFGNFHTDPFSGTPNIADSGNNFQEFVGVGADGTLGTADDVDVDLAFDTFRPAEGFSGLEDSLNTIALVIHDLGPFFADGFESGDTTAWSTSNP